MKNNISRLPLVVYNTFTITHSPWITENGKRQTQGKWITENGKRLALIVIIVAAMSATAGSAAASPPKPTGVTISPAFQQASISADQQQQPVSFKITNNESTARTYSLSVADFNTLGESGGLFFVGTNPTQLQKKYGLAKWLSLPQKTITLQPKQTTTVQAEILNLPDLAPGGHYGALMLQAEQPGKNSGTNQVSVHPIASSLLFVTKIGGDTHRLSLAGVTFSRTLFSLPSSVQLRFHNDGNTHVIPRGSVYIRTAAGKLISRGTINEDSNIILPETYRQFSVPLSRTGSFPPSGKYQLRVDFRFDGIDIYRTYQQSFTVIQKWTVIVLIIVIFAVIAGLRYGRKFRYKFLRKQPDKDDRHK